MRYLRLFKIRSKKEYILFKSGVLCNTYNPRKKYVNPYKECYNCAQFKYKKVNEFTKYLNDMFKNTNLKDILASF